MKLFLRQNNKKKLVLKTSDRNGFALLFSVLVSSFLLTIGLSVLNISLKELTISSASRQSIYAIYAAESGYECATYWDNRNALPPPPKKTYGWPGSDIVCGNMSKTFDAVPGTPDGSDVGISEVSNIYNDTDGYILVDSDNDVSGPNFTIKVVKTVIDTGIETVITSTGHDTTVGDRVERSLERKL